MISILVCSVSPDLLSQLELNVSSTIGVPYELLSKDNKNSNRGICNVYNELAEKSKFELLLFLHEDVLFQDQGWGLRLVEVFEKNKDYGVFGLAGSSYKSFLLSGWYTGVKEWDFFQITHRTNGRDHFISQGNNTKGLNDVICLDGVFIAARKSIWNQIKFNEDLLKGFHFYDLDFSLRASRITKLAVLHFINLIHITVGGDFGSKWVEQALLFHRSSDYIEEVRMNRNNKVGEEDLVVVRSWLDFLKNQSISFKLKWKWIVSQRLFRYPKLYYSIVKFICYKPFRLDRLHKVYLKFSMTSK